MKLKQSEVYLFIGVVLNLLQLAVIAVLTLYSALHFAIPLSFIICLFSVMVLIAAVEDEEKFEDLERRVAANDLLPRVVAQKSVVTSTPSRRTYLPSGVHSVGPDT